MNWTAVTQPAFFNQRTSGRSFFSLALRDLGDQSQPGGKLPLVAYTGYLKGEICYCEQRHFMAVITSRTLHGFDLFTLTM